MSNRSNKPVPSFSGVPLPRNIVVDTQDNDTGVTRRAAGAVVFNEPLLQSTDSGPANAHSGATTSRTISKSSAMTPKTTTPVHLKTQAAPVIVSWSDKLAGGDIPALPAFLTLEQTACFVPHVASVSRVAARIDSVLKDFSIEASFDGAKANCVTMEGVEFCIRLYRGRGKFSHGIIVEVQRRNGTSLRFHNDVAAILSAAQGKKPRTPTSTSNTLPVVSDTEDDDFDTPRRSSTGTLEIVKKMLQHPGTLDLGLQTLATFCDPRKMGASSLAVSRQLLEPGNSVGAKVVSLIVSEQSNKQSRILAMEALANALSNVAQASSTSCLPVEKLKIVLQKVVSECDQHPRAAYVAMRLLEPLLDGNCADEQLNQEILTARAVGESSYSALAQQANRVLECVSSR